MTAMANIQAFLIGQLLPGLAAVFVFKYVTGVPLKTEVPS
jgi:hypothetical protein